MANQLSPDSKEKLRRLGELWKESLRAREKDELGVIAEEDTAEDEDSFDAENDFQEAGAEDLDSEDADLITNRMGQQLTRSYRTALPLSTTSSQRNRNRSSIITTTSALGTDQSTIVVTGHGKSSYRNDNRVYQTTAEAYSQRPDKGYNSTVRLYRQVQGVSVVSKTTSLSRGELYLYNHPILGQYRARDPSLLRICWTPLE